MNDKNYFAKDNAERWYDTVGKDWIGYHKKRDLAEARRDERELRRVEKAWRRQEARDLRRYERETNREFRKGF